MKRSVFISRSLPDSSVLITYLRENDWEIHCQSLIEIEPVEFEISTETDWIFISSSNGARILLESYKPKAKTKIGVVGEATANTVRKFGFEPAFVGNSGDMLKVGQEFNEVLASETVLFVGAKGGSEKLRNQLQQTQVFFTAIYTTTIMVNQHIPETDAVYLTSPSNAEAYLTVNPLIGKTVIAIGNTTAEFLESKGVQNVLIPKSPKEEDVIELFRTLSV